MSKAIKESVIEAIERAEAQAIHDASAWTADDTLTPDEMAGAEKVARAVGWRVTWANVTNGQLVVHLTRQDTMHDFTRALLSSILATKNPADEWYGRQRFEVTFNSYDNNGDVATGIAEAVKAGGAAGWVVSATMEDYNALVRFKAVKWDAGA